MKMNLTFGPYFQIIRTEIAAVTQTMNVKLIARNVYTGDLRI